MKKTVAFFTTIVFVAFLGAPYFLGIWVKKEYTQNITQLEKDLKWPLKIVDYRRGFFSSTALTSITLFGQEFKVQCEIKHGPILFDSASVKTNAMKLGAALVYNIQPISEITEFSKVSNPNTWKALVDFKGNVKLYAQDTGDQSSAGDTFIAWDKSEAEGFIDKANKSFNLSLKIPEVRAEDAHKSFVFKNMLDKFYIKHLKNNLCEGKFSASADELKIFDGNTTYLIDKLVYSVAFDLMGKTDNALYEGKLDFELNKIKTTMSDYGPFGIFVRIKNIDPEGMFMLWEVLKDPKKSIGSTEKKSIIMKLLRQAPTFSLENTKITIPGGDINIDATITIGGQDLKEDFDDSILMSTLEGNVNMVITKEWMKKFLELTKVDEIMASRAAKSEMEQKENLDKEVRNTIEVYKDNGLLAEEGQNYILKFDISKGKIVVNGKDIGIALEDGLLK